MNRILSFALAVALALGTGQAALAQVRPGNITPTNPESVREALLQAGYRAKLTKDETGDPLIESAANGYDFKVFFYGCTANTDCRTLQFYAGFQKPDHGTLEDLNKWNSANRFGRAYLKDDGVARLEMDITLDGEGMGPGLFADNLAFWDALMGQFAEAIWD
ncbi:YbjN domain-containing protein [Tsuneonella sp. HG222]